MTLLAPGRQVTSGSKVAVGSNNTLGLSINGGSAYTIVAETISPSWSSQKTELRRGDGATYLTYFTDPRKMLTIQFYLLGNTPAAAATATSGLNIIPGDKITFSTQGSNPPAFQMLSGTWLVDTFEETRNFGDVFRVTLGLTHYPAA